MKARHGIDAAGAGDAGKVDRVEHLGSCPSCGADLHLGRAWDPITSRFMRALLHALPFCTYFGVTSPEEILRACVPPGDS